MNSINIPVQWIEEQLPDLHSLSKLPALLSEQKALVKEAHQERMHWKSTKTTQLKSLKLELELIHHRLRETSHQYREFTKRMAGLKEPSPLFLKVQRQQCDLDRLMEAHAFLGNISKLSDLIDQLEIEMEGDRLETMIEIYKKFSNDLQELKSNDLGEKLEGRVNQVKERVRDRLCALKNLSETESPSFAAQIFLKAPLRAFRYHFSGKRETNRIDKADFCLGFEQEMLARVERDTPVWEESPILLLHTANELLAFDRTVRDTFFSWKFPRRPGMVDTLCLKASFLESWIAFRLDECLEKLDAILIDPKAWDPDLSPQTIVSCVAVIELTESITEDYKDLEPPLRKLFFNEIQLVLLETYLQDIRRQIQALADTFKPIGSTAASLDGLCERLASLSKYHCGLTQMTLWLDFWSNDMVLALEDDDPGVFEDVQSAYSDIAKKIRDLIVDEVSVSFDNSIWTYKHRKALENVSESVTPSLIESLVLLDNVFQLLQDSCMLDRISDALLIKVDEQLMECKVTEFDLVKGVMPVLERRGIKKQQMRVFQDD